jgi:putative hydrolase of the HAD superfamily
MHTPIRGVLLDAGNTLVFVDSRRVVPVLLEAGADEAEALYYEAERDARMALSIARGQGVTGHEDQFWRDYVGTIVRRVGVPEARMVEVSETLRRMHHEDHLWTHVQEGTVEAIVRMREMRYRLGVVSNADGRVAALLQRLGLAELVEFVIDSHVVGVSKPDPRIFRMGADRLGLEPGQCLYVGDLYAIDVLGARAAGLQPLLLDPFGRLAQWDDVERIASVAELPEWLAVRGSRSRSGQGDGTPGAG